MRLTKSISITRLTLIVSGFITATCNYKFFVEAITIYPFQENPLFVISLLFWLFSFLSVVLLLVCYRFNTKFILIALLICTSVISYFTDNYGVVFDDNMIDNIFVTNLNESLDLLSLKLLFYFIFLGFIPAIIVYKAEITYKTLNQQLWLKIKAITLLLILFAGVTLVFSKSYASLLREHKQLRLYINPSYYVYALGKHINSQFKTISTPFNKIGEDAFVSRHNNASKLIIVVAGETARADRFALNGYERATNPLLSKQRVINFSQMYSCGTDTALSIPCMFSNLTREVSKLFPILL